MKARILLIALLVAGSMQIQAAEPCKDALGILRGIEARTETGISLSDYSRLIGDANVSVKMTLLEASTVG